MTMNLFAVQQQILAHGVAELPFRLADTEIPTLETLPEVNGRPETWAVIRFNDAIGTNRDRAVAGARYDGMYTLVDFICIGATSEKAREAAYGLGGVLDTFTGFKPDDGGEMNKTVGGQVFTITDANARPSAFLARVSFRLLANMETESA